MIADILPPQPHYADQEATVTNRADIRVTIADYGLAKRKRARHFWGVVGEVLRLEARRHVRQGARHKTERGTDISQLIFIEK